MILNLSVIKKNNLRRVKETFSLDTAITVFFFGTSLCFKIYPFFVKPLETLKQEVVMANNLSFIGHSFRKHSENTFYKHKNHYGSYCFSKNQENITQMTKTNVKI